MMRLNIHYLARLLVAVMLFPAQSFAQAPLDAFNAEYEVIRNGILIGHTSRVFLKNENGYEFRSSTKPAGIANLFFSIKINEKSILKYKNDQFYLHEYQYQKIEKNKNEAFSIRYQAGKNTLYHSHTQQHYPVFKQQYDMLSFVIGLMADLSTNKDHLHYLILEKSKLRDYLLNITGNTIFTYQGEKFPVRKLEQIKLPARDQFIFWCAKNLQNLPLRIQKVEADGDEIVMNLIRYNGKKLEFRVEQADSLQ